MNKIVVGTAFLGLGLLYIGCSSDSSDTSSGVDSGAPTGVDGGADAGQLAACDPLATPAATLGTLLGVGKDSASTLYVVDDPAGDTTGSDLRVFVSSGSTLVRAHVTGSGSFGGSPNASYNFTFVDPSADASTRNLLLVTQNDVATAMAFGTDGKSMYAPDAGDTDLTLVPASTLAGLAVRDAPAVVDFVGDVSDGTVLVVTAPTNDADGASSYRVYFGTPGAMVERTVSQIDGDDFGTYVTFAVDGQMYRADFADTFGSTDAGGGVMPGTLTEGSKTLALTTRQPTPTTLSGFAFSCPVVESRDRVP